MLQKEVTTKAGAIIHRKLQYPNFTLKKIAQLSGSSYGYARNVWSNYVRQQLTIRGSPLTPMSVHGWFFWTQIRPDVYYGCPVEPSANRNLQKVWRGRKCSVVFHKSGSTFIYPYFMGWDVELRDFLIGWVSDGKPQVDAIMSSLKEHGKKEIAFHTPGVPRKFKFRIKGLGTFKTDSTPYPDGTTEYEIDPGFERRLINIQKVQKNLLRVQLGQVEYTKISTDAIKDFAVAMKEHVKLIETVQVVASNVQVLVSSVQLIVDSLGDTVKQLGKKLE